MVNKNLMKDEREKNLNLLVSKYNLYLQENLFDYTKNKICDIKIKLKNGNYNEKDKIYFKGVLDTCEEIREIMRRKYDNKE